MNTTLPMEVQDFGRSIVVNNCPESFLPYDQLEYCENVEREGEGSYRFDGVYPDTKADFLKILQSVQ